jgi:uncharacterized protein YgiM (DUF1202 family)
MKKKVSLVFFLILYNFGFSQSYLGTITKQVNFRQGPSSDYEIISSLKPGTQVFISSIEIEDDFYNIIDIKSDKEGYVHKSFVKVGKLISKSDGGFIQETGNSTTDNAEANIFNNTNITMTLKLNSEVYKFMPKETKNIVLTPGDYSFRASAPNVIPNVGVKNFKINGAYNWQFYIQTRRR